MHTWKDVFGCCAVGVDSHCCLFLLSTSPPTRAYRTDPHLQGHGDEVHGDGELFAVELAVTVVVGQLPDLPQRLHREPRPQEELQEGIMFGRRSVSMII